MHTNRQVTRHVAVPGWGLAFAFVALVATRPAQGATPATIVEGTHQTIGSRDGLSVDVMVEGPASQQTPLQVACVFEYTEGDLTKPPALPAGLNGMRHLDEQLGGLITELRRSGKFEGRALETILLTPPKGTIAPEHVLLVGLGDRNHFTLDLMEEVGRIGMREALRLGVKSYSHASDLKDAGLDSPTGAVAEAVVRGAVAALETQQFLVGKKESLPVSVAQLTMLSGPSFYDATSAAVRKVLAATATPAPSR